MTNFCLPYNSILWFCEEVVAKNHKRDRENHRTGVRGRVLGNLDPAKGSWPLAGLSPLSSLSRD